MWNDVIPNGVQDPTEPGIANIVLGLYDRSGSLVATAKTRFDGTYLFSSASNSDTSDESEANNLLLIPGDIGYEIRVEPTNFTPEDTSTNTPK